MIPQYNDLEKGWLAAAIDGEGSIRVSRQKSRYQVSVKNTHEGFINEAARLLGSSSRTYREQPSGNRKLSFTACLFRTAEIVACLEQIEPYLIVKKYAAQQAIKVCKEVAHGSGRWQWQEQS